MNEFIDMIKGRKSIRTFDGNTLSDEHRTDIEEYMKDISNPFGIPIEFMLLDATEHELSSPVLSGERLYVAGKVEKKSYADVAFGYSFEKLIALFDGECRVNVLLESTLKRLRYFDEILTIDKYLYR